VSPGCFVPMERVFGGFTPAVWWLRSALDTLISGRGQQGALHGSIRGAGPRLANDGFREGFRMPARR
jgi:hypothetical protein